MPRPKKPKYEWVESHNCYRKRVKDADGKYVAIYAKTPEELTEKLRAVEWEIEDAIYRRDHPTVEEYANKWLQMHSSRIRATTMINYTSNTKIYLIEPLGDKYLFEVTPDDVKTAIGKAAKQSSSIYRSVQMLYKMIFQSAVDTGLIDSNPAADLPSKGGKPPKKKVALTDEQCQTLLNATRGFPPYVFIMLCLYAGLRREEALALKWKYVHLRGQTPYIEVRLAWHVEHNRPVISDELKTAASERVIPIPPVLVECLREHKKKSRSEFVISNSEGQPLSGTQWRRLWNYVTVRMVKPRTYKRYVDGKPEIHYIDPVKGEHAAHNKGCVYSIDFDVHPHQLRRTYISNMLRRGADIKTVQYLVGHERAAMTLDVYARLVYNQPEDLMPAVLQAFAV